jgi:hypothetical protein
MHKFHMLICLSHRNTGILHHAHFPVDVHCRIERSAWLGDCHTLNKPILWVLGYLLKPILEIDGYNQGIE